MTTYGFTFVLSAATSADDSERVADALYDGRCDDCAVHTEGPTVLVSFDREADSFAAAVASALADLRAEDLAVARIEIDGEDIPPLLAETPGYTPPADPSLAAAA